MHVTCQKPNRIAIEFHRKLSIRVRGGTILRGMFGVVVYLKKDRCVQLKVVLIDRLIGV